MKTLFIDTTSEIYNISIFQENCLLNEKKGFSNQDLSKNLVEIVNSLLKECNFVADDVDKIVVIDGPGSFTGIRMGVTVAKTYAWALNKEISSISKLLLMAINSDGDLKMPIIHARADDYYFGLYDGDNKAIINDTHMSKNEILKIIDIYKPIIITNSEEFEQRRLPLENSLGLIKHIENLNSKNPHKVNPKYLKLTQAEASLND
jgi:tRNA threonylcarbamoyladenosine biosynthesis protein TsaB